MVPAAAVVSKGGDVRAHRYRITISGRLDEAGREVFGDFVIEPDGRTPCWTRRPCTGR